MAYPGLLLTWYRDRPQLRTLRLPFGEEFRLGRVLVRNDKYVSTRHATVYARRDPDNFVVANVSDNGTFVDGEQVVGQALAWDRSVIRTGHSMWMVHRDITRVEALAPGRDPSTSHAPDAPVTPEAIPFVIADTVRAHRGTELVHYSAVQRCLMSVFPTRGALVAAIEIALDRCAATGADQLRDKHLPDLPPLRPVVPFARYFEYVMGAPPPFAIPDQYVCRAFDRLSGGIRHEMFIASDLSPPVIVQVQLGAALQMPPGYIMAGFWGHGVNSDSVYLARATERSRLYLRLAYGAGAYCEDPEAERKRALASLERYSQLAESLPAKRVTLLDSLGKAYYEIVRLDDRVVSSPHDLFSLDDVDLLALARG